MKPSFHFASLLLFLFFLIITSSTLSARLLTSEQGNFVSELEDISDSTTLMGMEDCNSGDEECFKRRMTMEAHLDYIYTQHHKP